MNFEKFERFCGRAAASALFHRFLTRLAIITPRLHVLCLTPKFYLPVCRLRLLLFERFDSFIANCLILGVLSCL